MSRQDRPGGSERTAIKITNDADFQRMLDEIIAASDGHEIRITRVRVPGRSIDLAHIIGVSRPEVYRNLALTIGFHAGDDPTGRALGLLRMTPWEAVVVAADIAVKSGDVDLGFMDRFSGSLILTGPISEVRTAVEEIVAYFRDTLHFDVCPVTYR